MNRSWRLFVLLFSGLALSGCAWSYQYAGRTYNNPEEPLAAHRSDVQRAVDGVFHADTPLPDAVAISLPSRDVLRRNGITVSGSLKPPESSINYLLDLIEQGNAGYVSALRASNLFRSVQQLPPDSDRQTAKAAGTGYFVSLTMPSTNQELLMLEDLNTGEKRRLQLSRRNLDSVFSSFIEDIRSVLKLWGVRVQ